MEFVESQQRALEDLLEPLEQAAANLPPSQQHADAEREAIFQMCINTDLELGQLLGELREMAERVNGVTADVEGKTLGGHGDATVAGSAASGASGANDANGGFDKTSTVVSQVTRVLNSHIHSLNWLNQNTRESPICFHHSLNSINMHSSQFGKVFHFLQKNVCYPWVFSFATILKSTLD